MSLQSELQRIGLSSSEAKLYLAALELGETNVSRLARKAGVKRTTAYLIADALKGRGLLHTAKKKKSTVYYAEDPRALIEQLDERKSIISGFLPELLSRANFIDKKPVIRFFEGDEGIREVYKDTLRNPGREILAMYSESSLQHFGEEYFSKFYVPRRIKLKIPVLTIMPDNVAMRGYARKNQEELRQSKFIDANLFGIEIEILIYGSRSIGILSFEEKIALIIESEKIHQSLASVFKTLWAFAP
jgi:sugar-specific transcriptional regulator TrmB